MEALRERIARTIKNFITLRDKSCIDDVCLLSSDHLDSDINVVAESIAAMVNAVSEPPKPPELPDVTGITGTFYASNDGRTVVMFHLSAKGEECWSTPYTPWLSRGDFTRQYQRLLPLRTVTANSIAPMKTNKEKEN